METIIIAVFVIAVVATVLYVSKKNASKKAKLTSTYTPPVSGSGGGKQPDELRND